MKEIYTHSFHSSNQLSTPLVIQKMNSLSLLALLSVLLIVFISAEAKSDSTSAIVSKPQKKAAAHKSHRTTKSKSRRRRPGAKRHPEDESEEDSFESIGGGKGEEGIEGRIFEEHNKECPRLSVAKERCTAFGQEVCTAHPNVFQIAPKIYHACLRDYCRGFARRCQILETIAQACGVEDSHAKLMEHGCDRVWKPSTNGKQKKGKTAKAFKRG